MHCPFSSLGRQKKARTKASAKVLMSLCYYAGVRDLPNLSLFSCVLCPVCVCVCVTRDDSTHSQTARLNRDICYHCCKPCVYVCDAQIFQINMCVCVCVHRLRVQYPDTMGAAGSRRWGAAHQYGSVKGMAFDAFGGVFCVRNGSGGR